MTVLENIKIRIGKRVTRYTFTCADNQYLTKNGIRAIKRIPHQHIYKSIINSNGFRITIPNNYNPLPEIRKILINPRYFKDVE